MRSNGKPHVATRTRNCDDHLIVDPKNPLAIARKFRDQQYGHRDCAKLWYCDDAFHCWEGASYRELLPIEVRAKAYQFLETLKWRSAAGVEQIKATRHLVDSLIDALKAESFNGLRQPCWICDNDQKIGHFPPAREILACQNGLFHVVGNELACLTVPTPLFFSHSYLAYCYDPLASEPTEWLRFLDSLWPDDSESIALLQEWFGYCLTHDTSLQKALLIVGPPRSGKGTIAHILATLIGEENVCGPTLSSLAGQFGLQTFLGKMLAVVSDARLSARPDKAAIVERILSITGEDHLSVDRKNLTPITVRLPARILMLSNELPRLDDASGALASRFEVLVLDRSYLGAEDTELYGRLLLECPKILAWAIDGLVRLRQAKRFTSPKTSAEVVEELANLGSPVSAFAKEMCVVELGVTVPIDELFRAWTWWNRRQGNSHAPAMNIFSRDLHAAVPGLRVVHKREGKRRVRIYSGIGLTLQARQEMQADLYAPFTGVLDNGQSEDGGLY